MLVSEEASIEATLTTARNWGVARIAMSYDPHSRQDETERLAARGCWGTLADALFVANRVNREDILLFRFVRLSLPEMLAPWLPHQLDPPSPAHRRRWLATTSG